MLTVVRASALGGHLVVRLSDMMRMDHYILKMNNNDDDDGVNNVNIDDDDDDDDDNNVNDVIKEDFV